jgi:hypothetical protein
MSNIAKQETTIENAPAGQDEHRARQMRLVAAAVRAPSGDNCQPWCFQFEGDRRICIHFLPERAKSFFDYGHGATSLSVGAAIENMRIQAASEGWRLRVEYPNGGAMSHPTAVQLIPDAKASAAPDILAAMLKRTVNRRPFLPWPLSSKTLERLVTDPIEGIGIRIIRQRKSIAQWARIIELGDRIRFSHPHIHEELFSKLLFDRETAQRVRLGLEVNRLGMGPLARPLLKFLQPWSRVNRLSRWGLIRLLAGQSRLLALSSAALVLVTIPTTSLADWIRAGEQVERLWVRAQEMGLGVHPMTVSLYLDHRYQREGMKNFLPEHRPLLQDLRIRLAALLPTGIGAMLFRLGYGWKMNHTAVRLPTEAFLKVESRRVEER